jgi:hypothetical protein
MDKIGLQPGLVPVNAFIQPKVKDPCGSGFAALADGDQIPELPRHPRKKIRTGMF